MLLNIILLGKETVNLTLMCFTNDEEWSSTSVIDKAKSNSTSKHTFIHKGLANNDKYKYCK